MIPIFTMNIASFACASIVAISVAGQLTRNFQRTVSCEISWVCMTGPTCGSGPAVY